MSSATLKSAARAAAHLADDPVFEQRVKELIANVDSRCSLSDFQRDATPHINRLRETGTPTILTIKGKLDLMVVDAAALRSMFRKAVDIIVHQLSIAHKARGTTDPIYRPSSKALRKARADIAAGRVVDLDDDAVAAALIKSRKSGKGIPLQKVLKDSGLRS